MEKSNERTFVCKFCNKKFPSGKSLGGHIRIHTNQYSLDSESYNGNRLRDNSKKKNKRLVDQRETLALRQQLCKGFYSLKALSAHLDSHSDEEKRVMMEQSISESFSNGSSSYASEIDKEHKNMALSLVMMSRDSNLVVNSLAESSENNSAILETKSSSGEQLKIFSVKKNQVLEIDEVAVNDQVRSAAADDDNDGDIVCDSDSSGSDYFMNGPKNSDSDISLDVCLKNTGFGSGFFSSLNRFKNSGELGVKVGGSKYELNKSKRVLPSSETDSCADTTSKSSMVKKAVDENQKSKGHKCPICFKVFKSRQALGGHKRSHSIGNQEHRIENQVGHASLQNRSQSSCCRY